MIGKIYFGKEEDTLNCRFDAVTETLDFKYMQKFVGGLIEFIKLPKNIDLVVNESFLLGNDLPSLLIIGEDTNEIGGLNTLVLGDCLFVSTDEDGTTIPLNEEQVTFLEDRLGTVGMRCAGDDEIEAYALNLIDCINSENEED